MTMMTDDDMCFVMSRVAENSSMMREYSGYFLVGVRVYYMNIPDIGPPYCILSIQYEPNDPSKIPRKYTWRSTDKELIEFMSDKSCSMMTGSIEITDRKILDMYDGMLNL